MKNDLGQRDNKNIIKTLKNEVSLNHNTQTCKCFGLSE